MGISWTTLLVIVFYCIYGKMHHMYRELCTCPYKVGFEGVFEPHIDLLIYSYNLQ